MSEQITRTITESLTHDDVQSALLEIVARRNPSYAKRDGDSVVFNRPMLPPLPGSPVNLTVDVKVTQEVLSPMSATLRVAKDSQSLWIQQVGRGHRPAPADAAGMLTEGFDFIPLAQRRPPTLFSTVSFGSDLRAMSNLANRIRHAARARGDVESERYFSEVYLLLCRDLGTVLMR